MLTRRKTERNEKINENVEKVIGRKEQGGEKEMKKIRFKRLTGCFFHLFKRIFNFINHYF